MCQSMVRAWILRLPGNRCTRRQSKSRNAALYASALHSKRGMSSRATTAQDSRFQFVKMVQQFAQNDGRLGNPPQLEQQRALIVSEHGVVRDGSVLVAAHSAQLAERSQHRSRRALVLHVLAQE